MADISVTGAAGTANLTGRQGTSAISQPITAALPPSGTIPLGFSSLGIPSGNLISVTLPAGADYDLRYSADNSENVPGVVGTLSLSGLLGTADINSTTNALTAAAPPTGTLPLFLASLGVPSGNLITLTFPSGADYELRYLVDPPGAVSVSVTGGVGTITRTGYAGTASSNVSIAGGVGNASLAGRQGTVSYTIGVNPIGVSLPPTGTLPLDLTSLGIPAGNLITITFPSGADYELRYREGVADTNPVVVSQPAPVTITGRQATLVATSAIAGGLGTVASSGKLGAASVPITVTGSLAALSLTGRQGTLSAASAVSSGASARTLTGNQASATSSSTVSAGLGSVSITGRQGTTTNISAIAGGLGLVNFSGLQGSITTTVATSGGVQTLTLASGPASAAGSPVAAGGVAALTLTGRQGSSTNTVLSNTAALGTVSISSLPGTVSAASPADIVGNLGVVTITALQGSASVNIDSLGTSRALALGTGAGSVISSSNILSTVGSADFTGRQGVVVAAVNGNNADVISQDRDVIITAYAGSVTSNSALQADAGAIDIVGFSATTNSQITVEGASATKVLTGFIGDVAISSAISSNPSALTLTGEIGSTGSSLFLTSEPEVKSFKGHDGEASITVRAVSMASSISVGSQISQASSSVDLQNGVVPTVATGFTGAASINHSIPGQVGSLLISGAQGSSKLDVPIAAGAGTLTKQTGQGSVETISSITGEVGLVALRGYAGRLFDRDPVDADIEGRTYNIRLISLPNAGVTITGGGDIDLEPTNLVYPSGDMQSEVLGAGRNVGLQLELVGHEGSVVINNIQPFGQAKTTRLNKDR